MALEARELVKTFTSGHGANRRMKVAAAGVSVKVSPGEFAAVVGESGSGKSTLARMLLGLIPPDSGRVLWGGTDLRQMGSGAEREFRRSVQAIFQDPAGSLNPRKRVMRLLTEVINHFRVVPPNEAPAEASRLLETVGLVPAEFFFQRYPHELSGGQRQRVLIARAMVTRPRLIIADEAVSALDMSVKAGVLDVMESLRQENGVGYLLISHDLPVVRRVAQFVYVMRAGEIVESGPTAELFEAPRHEYTRELLSAALDLDSEIARRR